MVTPKAECLLPAHPQASPALVGVPTMGRSGALTSLFRQKGPLGPGLCGRGLGAGAGQHHGLHGDHARGGGLPLAGHDDRRAG